MTIISESLGEALLDDKLLKSNQSPDVAPKAPRRAIYFVFGQSKALNTKDSKVWNAAQQEGIFWIFLSALRVLCV
jgi:hypothetical protein